MTSAADLQHLHQVIRRLAEVGITEDEVALLTTLETD